VRRKTVLVRTLLSLFFSLLLSLFAYGQWDYIGKAATISQLYQTPPDPGTVNWALSKAKGNEKVFYCTFQSAVPSKYPKNQTVPVWLYEPATGNGPFPMVLVLHYLGALDLGSEVSLAHKLNQRGIAALLIALPYHLSRTPNGFRSGQLAIVPNVDSLTQTMVQSVWDSRDAISLALKRPEIESSPVGIAGISLGSVVAEIAYGIDKRITNGAFVLGGSELGSILWHSITVVEVKERLRREGFTEAKLTRSLMPIEPNVYLDARESQNPGETRNCLVVSAQFDRVIPPFATLSLVRSLPDPYQIKIDTGHYGGAFVQSRIETEVSNFFAASDQNQVFTPPRKIDAPTLRLAAQAMTSVGFDIGIGVDLFRTHEVEPFFGTFMVTPRGAEMFMGKEISNGISFGIVGGTRGAGIGVFWSTIL